MTRERRWRGAFLGLAIGLLAALTLWPSSGWLVKSQLRLLLPTAGVRAAWGPVSIDEQTEALTQCKQDFRIASSREPNNPKAQVAWALLDGDPLNGPTDDSFRDRLRAAALHFPNQPIFRAATLSLSTRFQVHIRRPEVGWLMGEAAKKGSGRDPYSPRENENLPQHLREYDEDAAAGERLDPSNAYFPFMRAIGQFAAGQDAQAMASIERGSAKPNWNDYIGQELEAELGLYQVTYGVVSGLPRRAIVAAIIMPHLNEIQTAARLAIALAARMELHGHAALGLKIRQAILKCGGAMRVQSQQLIGNLVGRAVENMSIMRPGGVGQITRNANLSQAAWSALRLAELRAFFESTGHAGAYSEFEVELQRGQELRRITAQLQQVDFEESVWKSGVGWIVGLLLLSFAGWLTVLALVSSFVVSRVGRSENGRPKNRSGLMLVSCLLVGLISSWQISESLGPVVRMTWGFLSEGRPEPSRVVLAFAPVFVLGIPLTVLAVLAIVSLYRSIPVGDLIGRLLSRWAIPAIALLVFAYGLSVPFTVRQEAALNQTVDQIARNEGRFLAEGIGATWPP